MLVGIVDSGVEQSTANLEIVNNSGGHPSACMQPTAAATLPTPTQLPDMDLQAMQSMDWLFKKERIYLLAQFWQQVSFSFLSNTPPKKKRNKTTEKNEHQSNTNKSQNNF